MQRRDGKAEKSVRLRKLKRCCHLSFYVYSCANVVLLHWGDLSSNVNVKSL